MQTELKCERMFRDNGNIRREWWSNSEGKLHNESGPAFRWWHDNGVIACESHYQNGKFHNGTGPAYRRWHENGQLSREEFYLNGRKLTYRALLHECEFWQ
jgi:antitoxin component YwqK of YwqJK toxin-antitoxin module